VRDRARRNTPASISQGNRAKKFWTNPSDAESVAIHRITYGRAAVEMSADETEAFYETVVFLQYFNDLPDARQSGKVKYPLDEILLLCLLAVLAGSDTITDIAKFGRHKLAFLRRFRPFADGTPAHDHLGDILATLDAEQFQRCFVAWVAARTGVPAEVIAIDGKTLRRSGSKTSKKKKQDLAGPIHVVSAFAAGQRLVLGQVKVGEKSNEIVAIPKLLKLLAIEGAVVTIDAMGCQREISQAIIEKKADYILALKGNQGTLKDDVKLFFDEQKAIGFKDTKVSRDKSVDGDHARIETREVTVIHDAGWLRDKHDWPGLKSVIVVESTREINGKIDYETRFYITSLVLFAQYIGPLIRSHWMIENGLHWIMDMVFRDDECRLRIDNAPANFATMKHIAYNLMRKATTKDSMRLRRKVAAWDDDFLASLVAA
jgi:predicted transposase YbfD/YdcC